MQDTKFSASSNHFNPRSHEESGTDAFYWCVCHCDFNPRSHEESGVTLAYKPFVSISFQSTLSRGERPVIEQYNTAQRQFQSTLSRGERRGDRLITWKLQKDFNPRSHEESGVTMMTLTSTVLYFNPRSHEESGKKTLMRYYGLTAFQSTLSRGERPWSSLSSRLDR